MSKKQMMLEVTATIIASKQCGDVVELAGEGCGFYVKGIGRHWDMSVSGEIYHPHDIASQISHKVYQPDHWGMNYTAVSIE